MTRIVLFVVLAFSGLSAWAEAQKVAVVDLRAALLASNAAKEFGESLRKEFAEDERRLKELGDQAKALQERLKKDGAIMVEAERNTLSAELDEKAQEFNFLKNKYQSAVGKREEIFLKSSKPMIDEAIQKLASDGNYDLILPQNMAVYVSAELDLTPQLIEALNQ